MGSRDPVKGKRTALQLEGWLRISNDVRNINLFCDSMPNQLSSSIEGGTMAWAAEHGDIIVLATPFTSTIQAIESVAAVDLHMAFLDDPTARWAIGYKSVLLNRLSFGSRGAQELIRSTCSAARDACGRRLTFAGTAMLGWPSLIW
eukprot:768013-Hanusia_phi.AAC.14